MIHEIRIRKEIGGESISSVPRHFWRLFKCKRLKENCNRSYHYWNNSRPTMDLLINPYHRPCMQISEEATRWIKKLKQQKKSVRNMNTYLITDCFLCARGGDQHTDGEDLPPMTRGLWQQPIKRRGSCRQRWTTLKGRYLVVL